MAKETDKMMSRMVHYVHSQLLSTCFSFVAHLDHKNLSVIEKAMPIKCSTVTLKVMITAQIQHLATVHAILITLTSSPVFFFVELFMFVMRLQLTDKSKLHL